MSCEIYYFSGTGNSLHVAKELEKRISNTSLVPIVSIRDKENIKTGGETVGFVFPIHFMSAPVVVKDVIKRLDLESAKYVFAIATRHGTPCSLIFTKIEKILKGKGKGLDAYLILNMANNDPKFKDWHSPTAEEMAKSESQIQDRLDSFQEIIKGKIKYREEDRHIVHPINPVMEPIYFFLGEISGGGTEGFYSDSKCTGCGICEEVCLSHKIKMVEGKPLWQRNVKCFSCYACLNYCPTQSVQLRSNGFMKFYTDVNGRYVHPESSPKDIAAQK